MKRRELLKRIGVADGSILGAGCMVSSDRRYYFGPIGRFVSRGETVRWINKRGSHSATAYKKGNGSTEVTRVPESTEGWNSGVIDEARKTCEYTFRKPEIYDCFCIPRKSLGVVCRLVVGEPGGSAVESTLPDGEVPESSRIVEERAVAFDDSTS